MKHQKLFIAVMGMRVMFAACAIISTIYFIKPTLSSPKKPETLNKHIVRKKSHENCKAEILIALNN